MEGIPQQAKDIKPSFLQKKKIKWHSEKVEGKPAKQNQHTTTKPNTHKPTKHKRKNHNEKKWKQTIINSDEATWK